jgi:hypothetical protein
VASNVTASNIKQKIEDAFKRHAIFDAKDIEVDGENRPVSHSLFRDELDSARFTALGTSCRDGMSSDRGRIH